MDLPLSVVGSRGPSGKESALARLRRLFLGVVGRLPDGEGGDGKPERFDNAGTQARSFCSARGGRRFYSAQSWARLV